MLFIHTRTHAHERTHTHNTLESTSTKAKQFVPRTITNLCDPNSGLKSLLGIRSRYRCTNGSTLVCYIHSTLVCYIHSTLVCYIHSTLVCYIHGTLVCYIHSENVTNTKIANRTLPTCQTLQFCNYCRT